MSDHRDVFLSNLTVSRSRTARFRISKLLFFTLFIAVLSLALATFRLSALAQDGSDLSLMAKHFIAGIQENDLERALAVCAESPEGRRALAREVEHIFGHSNPTEEDQAETAVSMRLKTLRQLRVELDKLGVNWAEVTPLAFGGVRAKVLEQQSMAVPADVVLGNLYFTVEDRVYAIEVSAWHCDYGFIIVDIWDWSPVAVSPSALRTYAQHRYRRSLKQVGGTRPNAKIIRPREIYVKL